MRCVKYFTAFTGLRTLLLGQSINNQIEVVQLMQIKSVETNNKQK
jgi:hypothetical protein